MTALLVALVVAGWLVLGELLYRILRVAFAAAATVDTHIERWSPES